MKRISSDRLVLAVVFAVLCNSALTRILICPSPVLAGEQPQSLPPAPVPSQVVLHVKLLRIDETKLKEAKIDLSDLIGERRRNSAGEKPPTFTCETMDEKALSKLVERLEETDVGKVIAAPTIVTLDGREASLHNGGEVPILAVGETINGEKRTLIRHHAVGQDIRVVPKLVDQNAIRLDISVTVDQIVLVVDKKREVWTPRLESRRINTSQKLRPNQTVVLTYGQSVEDSVTDSETVRLLVAITPSLVSPIDAADEIKNLETKKNLLLDHYGSNHPKVMSLQSQLDLMQRLRSEKLRVAAAQETPTETTDADPLAQAEPAEERLRSSKGPSPRSSNSGERRAQRVDDGSILSEVQALREDVRTVRRDVNRLIELLENRQGSQDQSKRDKMSEPVSQDVPAESWDLTLREAITIALQNSKTLTVASAESTNGGPIRIRRSNADMSLVDAKDAAANLVTDVERTYWDLWRGYRNLDTAKAGRDASQQSWRDIYAQKVESDAPAELEQDARKQYFLFRRKMEDAIRAVYASGQRLRFLLGLPGEDGRLIRPSEDPTVTKTSFDWTKLQAEALENRPELARQRWKLRQSELELKAAEAHLQPAQESALPVGYRTPMAGMRNAQLQLAREQAVLEDIELNAVHELTEAVRNLDAAYSLAQTHSNRRKASEQEIEALTKHHSQAASRDTLADAQNRRAATAIDHWKSLVDFANALSDFHLKKGSLLSYRNIVVDDSAAVERDEDNRDASE